MTFQWQEWWIQAKTSTRLALWSKSWWASGFSTWQLVSHASLEFQWIVTIMWSHSPTNLVKNWL